MSESDPRPPGEALLSGGQRKIIAASLASTAFAVLGIFVIGGFYLLGLVVGKFSGVLWPLAVAGIIALMLRPIVEIIEARLKGRRLAAVIIVAGAMLILFFGFLLVVVPPAVDQVLELIAFVPVLWRDGSEYIQTHYPDWAHIAQRQLENPTIKSLVEQATQELQGLFKLAIPSLKAAGTGLMGVLTFATHLAVVPIYLIFFLLSRAQPASRLPNYLPFLSPSFRDDVVFLINEFISIIVSFFRGQLLIGMIMGVLYAIGFSLVGLKFGALVGMILGFLNIIPYLGSIIGLVITVPIALFQPDGGWKLLALTLGVQVVVQNIEGWLLTPKIMSDRTGLHPVMIIVAILFWGTALDGLMGMILAIPLTAFFVTAWRLAKRKYLHSVEATPGR